MVEIFFGTFRSVKGLTAAIERFIDAYNQRCQPFTWTKDADQLIAKATRPGPRSRRQPIPGERPVSRRQYVARGVRPVGTHGPGTAARAPVAGSTQLGRRRWISANNVR